MPITIKDMTELSQKIINDHQVRFTKKQKASFRQVLKTNMSDKTIDDKPLGKNNNIIINKIDNADVILTAHYDTPGVKWIFISNKKPAYKALCKTTLEKILRLFLCSASIQALRLAVIALPLMLLLSLLGVGYILNILITAACMAAAICSIFFPNKNNYNDNTSGVITLIEHMQTTKESEMKLAYIFFDNEEKRLSGSKELAEKVAGMNDKLIINLDCVGVGDDIHITLPNNSTIWNQINLAEIKIEGKTIHIVKQDDVYISSDHKSFPNAICITAYEKDKNEKLILRNIHTEKDDYMDYANIKAAIKILEIILQLIASKEVK